MSPPLWTSDRLRSTLSTDFFWDPEFTPEMWNDAERSSARTPGDTAEVTARQTARHDRKTRPPDFVIPSRCCPPLWFDPRLATNRIGDNNFLLPLIDADIANFLATPGREITFCAKFPIFHHKTRLPPDLVTRVDRRS